MCRATLSLVIRSVAGPSVKKSESQLRDLPTGTTQVLKKYFKPIIYKGLRLLSLTGTGFAPPIGFASVATVTIPLNSSAGWFADS